MARRPVLALAAAACLVGYAAPAAAQTSLWTLSCVNKGRILYRERTTQQASGDHQAELSRRYPGAMCIVLAPEAAAEGGSLGEALREAAPVAALQPNPLDGIGNALGFDAAIRALRGQSIPVAPATPPRPAVAETPRVEVDTPPETVSVRPAREAYVRLGLYSGDSVDDVMADWQRLAAAGPELAVYSPSLTRTPDGLTMLSVGPTTARERKSICLAAAGMGFDCMPGLAPDPEGIGAAVSSLERSYPGLVTWSPPPAMSPRTLGMPSAVDGTLACHSSEGLSRSGGLNLLALGVPPQRGPKAVAEKSRSSSSSASAPSSSLRKVLSAKARSLSASTPTVASAAPAAATSSRAP